MTLLPVLIGALIGVYLGVFLIMISLIKSAYSERGYCFAIVLALIWPVLYFL